MAWNRGARSGVFRSALSEHARDAIDHGADAIAVGAALHTDHLGLISMRKDMRAMGYPLRTMPTEIASHD